MPIVLRLLPAANKSTRRSVRCLRHKRRDQVEKWRGSPVDGHEVEGMSTVDLPAAQSSHTVTHMLWEPHCTGCRAAGTPVQHSRAIRCVGAGVLLEGENECTRSSPAAHSIEAAFFAMHVHVPCGCIAALAGRVQGCARRRGVHSLSSKLPSDPTIAYW